jgi:hypothetical protein
VLGCGRREEITKLNHFQQNGGMQQNLPNEYLKTLIPEK